MRSTRRGFFKTAGVLVGVSALAPAVSAPFVSRAYAQTKTLSIVQWSHFVPAFDTWFDKFAQ
jgi:multiple sugar transport system substrate-binding protein